MQKQPLNILYFCFEAITKQNINISYHDDDYIVFHHEFALNYFKS